MRKRLFMLYVAMVLAVSVPCAYGDETEPDVIAAPQLSISYDHLTWDIQRRICRNIKQVWNTSTHRYDEIDEGEEITYIVEDGSARALGITNTGSVCAKWNVSCQNPLFRISPSSGILDAGENRTIEVMIQTSMLDGESNVRMISDYLDLSYSAVWE